MPPAPEPRRRRGTFNGGWLFIFLVVLALAVGFVVYGDKLRAAFGLSHRPGSDGTEPTVPNGVQATVVAKTPPENPASSDVVTHEAAPMPVVATPVVAAPHEIQYKDQVAGERTLAEAQAAFTALDWDRARSAAERIYSLDVRPETMARAHDISSKTVVIVDLFKRLNDRDELTRNFDTDPSLVQLGTGLRAMLIVPLGPDGEVVADNPIGYITQMNDANPGHVPAMIKGNKSFIKSELSDQLIDMHLVDQKAVHAQKEAEFQRKVAGLSNSAAAKDGLAWYQAAKFAYRNRLDDHVAAMLDQAIELDPLLVHTVREDIAGRLTSSLLFHLHNHNVKQAQLYMVIIRQKYADTDEGKKAELYFNGDMKSLLALEAQESDKHKADEAARQQARIDRAKQEGDSAKATAIAQEAPTPDEPAAPVTADVPANADEASAQKAFDDGLQIYSKANDMPPTDDRNTMFRKASTYFVSAVAQYRKLVEANPNDETLQAKMVEANELRFGCEKNLTF